MKKRMIALFCCAGMTVLLFTGCGNTDKINSEKIESEKITTEEIESENIISDEAQMCQGTWVNYVGDKPINTYLQIDGEQVYYCYSDGSSVEVSAEFGTKDKVVYLKAQQPYLEDYDWYSLLKDESDNLILNDCLDEGHLTSTTYASGFKKVSDEIITIEFGKVPYVGMNKGELIFSSWGEPEDKNITKMASVTEEQWVYSDYKYIYLEDGIVTAIQE